MVPTTLFIDAICTVCAVCHHRITEPLASASVRIPPSVCFGLFLDSAGLTKLTSGNAAKLLRPKATDVLAADKVLQARKKKKKPNDGLLGNKKNKRSVDVHVCCLMGRKLIRIPSTRMLCALPLWSPRCQGPRIFGDHKQRREIAVFVITCLALFMC